MTLVLSYRSPGPIPVEIEGVTPQALRGKTRDEIRSWEIYQGNRKVQLGDFFAVSGDASDESIRFEGELSGVHWVGAKMQRGKIYVDGDAGRHVGSEMTGGCIEVAGDAADWLGGEMHGGRIHVRGRAGHLVGAAYRGCWYRDAGRVHVPFQGTPTSFVRKSPESDADQHARASGIPSHDRQSVA